MKGTELRIHKKILQTTTWRRLFLRWKRKDENLQLSCERIPFQFPRKLRNYQRFDSSCLPDRASLFLSDGIISNPFIVLFKNPYPLPVPFQKISFLLPSVCPLFPSAILSPFLSSRTCTPMREHAGGYSRGSMDEDLAAIFKRTRRHRLESLFSIRHATKKHLPHGFEKLHNYDRRRPHGNRGKSTEESVTRFPRRFSRRCLTSDSVESCRRADSFIYPCVLFAFQW